MSYSISQNRILPTHWQDVRNPTKWGFKIHKSCKAARDFFGIGINWKIRKDFVVCINTRSVKHWWKSNEAWRKSVGFGGKFSKKRLLALLNTQIQAQTTTTAIQKAGNSIRTNTPPPLVPQPNDADLLRFSCRKCEELIYTHKSKAYQNSNQFLKDLDAAVWPQVNVYREWAEYPQADGFKTVFAEREKIKSTIEAEIRRYRQIEVDRFKDNIIISISRPFIYRQIEVDRFKDNIIISISRPFIAAVNEFLYSSSAETQAKFIKDFGLNPPTFKEFDSETAKLMQYRWILLQLPALVKRENAKQFGEVTEALKASNLLDGVKLAQDICKKQPNPELEEEYGELSKNFAALQQWMEAHPQILTLDIAQAKEKLKESIPQVLQTHQRYEKYHTSQSRLDFTYMIDEAIRMKNGILLKDEEIHDRVFVNILQKLSLYLPKESFYDLKLRYLLLTYIQHGHKAPDALINSLRSQRHDEFRFHLIEAKVEIDYLEKENETFIDKQIVPKLIACHEALSSEKPAQEIWSVLHTHFPDRFKDYQAVDPALDGGLAVMVQEEQWLNIFLQILEELKKKIGKKYQEKIPEMQKKCADLKVPPLNPATFFDQQLELKQTCDEITTFYLATRYYLPYEKVKLDIPSEVYDYVSLVNPKDEPQLKEALGQVQQKWMVELLPKIQKGVNPAIQELVDVLVEVGKYNLNEFDLEALKEKIKNFHIYSTLFYKRSILKFGTHALTSPEGQFIETCNFLWALDNLVKRAATPASREMLYKEIIRHRKGNVNRMVPRS